MEAGFVKNKIFTRFPALRFLWFRCGRRFEMFWMRPENGPEIFEERDGECCVLFFMERPCQLDSTGLLGFRQRCNLERTFGEYSDAM